MKYLLYFLLLFSFSVGQSCKIKNRPNIILITVDDLGWTDLGCYGSEFYETPNIDRLAEEGFRFTNAYAAAAICSPTRAAIMTGKYPARTGITDWIRAKFQGGGDENREGFENLPDKQLLCPYNPYHLNLDEVTVAEIFNEHEYETCFIGKWHLGTERWYPDKQGFKYNIAGCDYGQPPSYFDPYIVYPDAWRKDTLNGFPTMAARKAGEYLTDREADEAIAFIKEHKDKSFFLNLCHYAVHTPLQAKEEIIEKYERKPPTHHKSAVYAAMVESVDNALGAILAILDELGISEKTMIIFTSDNGGLLIPEATVNIPLRSGKGYPYEGGIRIPTIFYWPDKIKPRQTSDMPIISTDYLPTICATAGIESSAFEETDGLNLLPHILQGRQLPRDAIFWHFPHYRGADVVPYSIIRKGEWKLIKRYQGSEFELFNLKNDLSETRELSERYPEKVAELNADLEAWLKEVGARMPIEKLEQL
jgi:arylsulfatase A-like enzyme